MTYFYCDPGIYMLGKINACSTDELYATLRIETPQKDDLVLLINDVFQQLEELGYQFDEWETYKYPFDGNRLQKRRFYSELAHRHPEHKEEFVDWPQDGDIPCKLYRLSRPYSPEHLPLAFDSGIIIIHKDTLSLKHLSELMRPYAKGMDCQSLVSICSKHPQWIVASVGYGLGFYLWQFVGLVDDVHLIKNIVRSSGSSEII